MFTQRKRVPFLKILLIPIIIAAALSVLGYIVMSLWNFVLPTVLHVGQIDFWQAVALLLLSRILFGGIRFGRDFRENRQHFRAKWINMSDEEREKFKKEWKRRCGK